jgi:hypothetical protein
MAIRTHDFEAQLAAIALSVERQSEEEKKSGKSLHQWSAPQVWLLNFGIGVGLFPSRTTLLAGASAEFVPCQFEYSDSRRFVQTF